jgi:hypothetical protein
LAAFRCVDQIPITDPPQLRQSPESALLDRDQHQINQPSHFIAAGCAEGPQIASHVIKNQTSAADTCGPLETPRFNIETHRNLEPGVGVL